MSEIANDRNRFQKYLRQNNCRADIDINTAAIEFLSHSTEEAEILISCFSKGLARRFRMCMDDVGSDGDMHGYRDFRGIRLGENTAGSVFELDACRCAISNESAQPFAQPDSIVRRRIYRGIHISTRLASHSK